MQNTFIDKLGFILIKDRKVLATRSKGKDVWFTPGGKRDAGETDEQALIREVKEELHVDLLPQTIAYFATYQAQAFGKPEGTIVRIVCYTAEYKGRLQASAEIEEIGWITTEDKEKTTVTGILILEDLKKKDLID